MSTSLKKDVFQHSFRNEYHKGIVNLVYTYGYVYTQLQKHFSEFDLTMQQFNILRILRGVYPHACTNSYIKERMLDKNSDVTRIINRLISNKLVARCSSTVDKRKVEISIQPKGLKLLEKIDLHSNKEDAILQSLTESEVTELNRLLEKIRSTEG